MDGIVAHATLLFGIEMGANFLHMMLDPVTKLRLVSCDSPCTN